MRDRLGEEKVGKLLLQFAVPSVISMLELVWTSSDPTIVTVDANGTITAVKEGSATITVTAGAYRAQCEVTVVAAEDET